MGTNGIRCRLRVVTMPVQELPVAPPVRSALCPRNDVVHFPHVLRGEGEMAGGAATRLGTQEAGHAPRQFGVVAGSPRPIAPIAVERALVAGDLAVPLNGRAGVVLQSLASAIRKGPSPLSRVPVPVC